MCATYQPTPRDRIAQHFEAVVTDAPYERIAFPGYKAPVIRRKGPSAECVPACFGMVPSWADQKKHFKHTYNARSETVAGKASFRNAWQRGQFCIIPADAIFEPSYESGKAARWEIRNEEDSPLAIAGIWETRPDGPYGEDLLSFSMLTINADEHTLMRRFHKPGEEKRCVVLLKPQEYAAWLDADAKKAEAFLKPYPAELMAAAAAPEETAAENETPRQADLF